MSESFAERLSRFTPDGAGLDRDTLLFAAGRASARPNRGWMTLACALAASNALMLVLLWPASPASVPLVVNSPVPSTIREDTQLAPELNSGQLRALSPQVFLLDERDWPRPTSVASLAPPDPPLRAYSGSALSN